MMQYSARFPRRRGLGATSSRRYIEGCQLVLDFEYFLQVLRYWSSYLSSWYLNFGIIILLLVPSDGGGC